MLCNKETHDKVKSGDRESIGIVLLEAPEMDHDSKSTPEEYAMEMIDESYGGEETNPFVEVLMEIGLPRPAAQDIGRKLLEAKEEGRL